MTDQNHDAPENGQESAPEAKKVEISSGLIAFVDGQGDEQQTEQEKAAKEAEAERRKAKDLKKAADVAKGALKAAEKAIEFWFKCNTGLNDDDRKEWAESMAPVMVEAGIKDYFGALDKYKIYIVAIVATGKLGATIANNVGQQLAEREQEQAEQEKVIQGEQSKQPVKTYQQDFAGRGGFVSETEPEAEAVA